MKRINIPLLITLVAIFFGGGLGIYLLHGYQAARSSKGNLIRAETHEKSGNYEEAIRALKRYVRYRPKDVEQLGKLALLMKEKLDQDFKKNRVDPEFYSEVRAYLEEALRKDPKNLKLREEAIELALDVRVRRYTDAIDHLKAYLAQKKTPETMAKLARAYKDSNQLEDAIPIVSELLGWDHPNRKFIDDASNGKGAANSATAEAKELDTTDAYVMLMQILMANKENEVADRVMAKMVEKLPNSASAHLQHCLYLATTKPDDLSPAQDELAKALSIAPDDLDVLLTAGRMAMFKKDTLRANATYQRCLELFPDNLDVYFGLYTVAVTDKDYDKALRYLDDGLKKSPGAPMLLFYKGNLEIELGKLEEAEKTIAAMEGPGVRMQPQFPDLLRARILLQKGEWLKSSKLFEQVRPHLQGLDSQIVAALDGEMAQCYGQLGQYDLQLRSIDRILERDYSNLGAIFAKIQAHLKLRQEEKAVELYDTLDRMIRNDESKNDLLVLERLQLELMKQKQLAEASRSWIRTDELKTQTEKLELSDALRDSLDAEILQAKGKTEEAENLVKKYREGKGNEMPVRLQELVRRAATEKYETLAPELDKIQEEIGDNLLVRNLRATVIVLSRPENASELLRTLEEKVDAFTDDQKVDLWLKLGRHHIALAAPENTKRLFALVIAKRPADVQLRLTMYELVLNSDNNDDIQTQLAEIEKLVSKDSPEWKWAEASRLFRVALKNNLNQDELAQAAKIVEEAIEQRPTWGQLYAIKGDIQMVQGKSDLAVESFEKAKETGSLNPLIDRSLARLYFDARKLPEAKRALEQLPRPLWTDLESRIELSLLAAEGKLPAKIPMDETKTNAEGFVWLGQLMAQVGRNAEATEAFNKALAKDPSAVLAWAGLFSQKITEGKADEAQKIATDAMQVIPEISRSSFNATTSRMLGKNDEAEKAYLETVRANPDKPEMQQELIKFYLDTNQPAKAQPILVQLVDEGNKGDPKRAPMVRWCRRQLARISAASGTYTDFLEATRLIEQNGENGKLSREDLILWIELAGNRPERVSREDAVAKLISEKETRTLNEDERFALARLYRGLGKWNECQSAMVDLLALQPKEPRYLEPWISWLLEEKEIDGAMRWITNLPPGSVASVRVKALRAVRDNQSDEAKKLLQSLIANPADAKDQLIRLRIVAQIAEDLAEGDPKMHTYAEAAWKKLVKSAPESSLDYAAYLARLKDIKRLDDCIAVCQTVFNQGRQMDAIQQALVALRHHRGAGPVFDTAIDTVRQWTRKRENFDSKLMLLQDCEFAEISGDLARQEQLLREYLEKYPVKDPRRAVVLNNLAYLLAIQGKADEAVGRANEAIEILGPVGSVRDTVGMAELARNDPKAAIVEFEKSIEDDGPTSMKYFHLARAHLLAKDQNAARAALDKAEELGLTMSDLGSLELESYRELVKEMRAAGLTVKDVTELAQDSKR